MAGYSRSFSYDKDISEISVVKVMQEKDKKREKKFTKIKNILEKR